MNRRSFIAGMLAVAIAPSFLKGAGRIWKRDTKLWTPSDLELYNSLPYYLARLGVKYTNEKIAENWRYFGENIGTFPVGMGTTIREIK